MKDKYQNNYVSNYDKQDLRQFQISSIDDVLKINNATDLDFKIFESTITIIKYYKALYQKLEIAYEMKPDEEQFFIDTIKFVDTLNLFMNQSSINCIVNYLEAINNLVYDFPNIEMRDNLLWRIKYTLKAIIFYKKFFFKNLFFQNDLVIYEHFKELIYDDNLEYKIFKQLQNLSYLFSKKMLDANYKELINVRMLELKERFNQSNKLYYEKKKEKETREGNLESEETNKNTTINSIQPSSSEIQHQETHPEISNTNKTAILPIDNSDSKPSNNQETHSSLYQSSNKEFQSESNKVYNYTINDLQELGNENENSSNYILYLIQIETLYLSFDTG